MVVRNMWRKSARRELNAGASAQRTAYACYENRQGKKKAGNMANKESKKDTKSQLDKYQRKARSIRSSLHRYGINGMSTKQIEAKLREGIICPYCHEALTPRFVSVDHIQPRSRGGADSIENIHFTCLSCNLTKGDLTDLEFKLLMEFLEANPTIKKSVVRRLKIGGASFYKGGKLVKQ